MVRSESGRQRIQQTKPIAETLVDCVHWAELKDRFLHFGLDRGEAVDRFLGNVANDGPSVVV